MEKITKNRIISLDLLRGIIMILMVLDHVRWFFHRDVNLYSPEDLSRTTPLLFFTRWITHFCAPGFIFLTGCSARLFCEKKNKQETSAFLWSRGILLIVLELTVFHLAWHGYWNGKEWELIVIWAIGCSMLLLGFAIQILSDAWLFLLGLIVVLGHNLLDRVKADSQTLSDKLWMILHQPGDFFVGGLQIDVTYPLLPYFGIVMLGWYFGRIYTKDFPMEERKKILAGLTLGTFSVFFLFRFFNIYGDPHPWKPQQFFIFSVLSFLKTTKYPTSLLYLSMTLSGCFFVLYFFNRVVPKILWPVTVFGQVPFFFYLLHLFLIRFLATLGGGMNTYTLPSVYLAWILVICLLYFPCLFYRNYKFSGKAKAWVKFV